MKLWHKQDNKFGRQHTFLYLHALPCNTNNNKITQSPLHRACADLLSSLAQDALTDVMHLACACELGQHASTLECGFRLKLCGFNDKLS